MLGPPSPDVLDDLPRGRQHDQVGMPPHAYFEPSRNLTATESLRFDAERNEASKLFLGVSGGQVITGERLLDGRLSRHVVGGTPIGIGDDRHHLVLAGSRAGKGRSCLLPVLLSAPSDTSLVAIDPKGDLAKITAPYRASLGQEVVSLDPFGVSGAGTEQFRGAFNPLDMLDPADSRTFVPNAKLIADSLIVSGDFKDRHWDETAKQILAALIVHICTFLRYLGARDLVTIWYLVSELMTPDPDNPKRPWLETEMLANDAAGNMVKNAARQFYDRADGERSSVLSNLRKHLDFLGIECMRDVLCGPSIDLRDLKRKSLALYITLPAMRMADLSGWLRMIIQLSIAAHEEESHQLGGSTVMLLDEFNVLGKLSCLETAAAQIAGLGLKLYTVLQDLSQLQSKYPKSWETFIGNTGCMQVFGLADQTSLEYVSKKLGETATITRSTNIPGFDQATQQGLSGESWSLGTHRLLTPDEIARFFARDDKQLRQLILRPGYRPAILQRAFYDKHELFRGRFADV